MSSNCFKKVNSGHFISEYSMEDLKLDLHMSHSRWQKYGLSLKKDEYYDAAIANTFEVSDKIKLEVLSKIPTELLNIEVPHIWYLEVTGGSDAKTMVPPHIDKFRICTINYYINTNGESTHYYSYEPSLLREIECFSSKNSECWILNTTIPHSVKLIPGKTRTILGASFLNTPYDKVINFFN